MVRSKRLSLEDPDFMQSNDGPKDRTKIQDSRFRQYVILDCGLWIVDCGAEEDLLIILNLES
jgi:hypothetical protein